MKNEPYRYRPLRNRAKYKKLARLPFNIINTLKILKFHNQKWLNFRRNAKRVYEHRIFCQSMYSLRSQRGFYKKVTKKRKSYRFQLKLKRHIQFFYGQRRYTNLKKKFLKKLLILHDNIYIKLNNILSLFAHYEQRLDVIFYRLHFFPTIYASQEFIKTNTILINKKRHSFLNYSLKVNDLVEIKTNRYLIYQHLKYLLKTRTRQKINFFKILNYRHLEVNYSMLLILLIKPIYKVNQLKTFFSFHINFTMLQLYFFRH